MSHDLPSRFDKGTQQRGIARTDIGIDRCRGDDPGSTEDGDQPLQTNPIAVLSPPVVGNLWIPRHQMRLERRSAGTWLEPLDVHHRPDGNDRAIWPPRSRCQRPAAHVRPDCMVPIAAHLFLLWSPWHAALASSMVRLSSSGAVDYPSTMALLFVVWPRSAQLDPSHATALSRRHDIFLAPCGVLQSIHRVSRDTHVSVCTRG